jgi:hypothetical protein
MVVAVAVVLVLGPLLLGLSGVFHARRGRYRSPEPAVPWNWKQTISSALLYTLAFNLTFFIQELFLVLPKALIPGVRPTLFHNNHSWQGENPLTSLFQGTGALAILLSGVVCALLLQRRSPRSCTVRLFVIWMAYNGLFQALPQVVIGAISPQNDVGMAMNYLRLGSTARTAAALAALALMPPAALWLTRHLLGAAEHTAQLSSSGERTRFIFHVATLPALIAVVLIIPFRVPRELIEVVGPPVVVTLLGMVWVQAGAWRFDRVTSQGEAGAGSIAYPLSAVLVLLLVFQLFLKPGIPFYQVRSGPGTGGETPASPPQSAWSSGGQSPLPARGAGPCPGPNRSRQ